MIRSSALLTVAAMAMLVAGVFSASLGLIYASIAVSILAALTLGAGVLLRRRELFGAATAGDIQPGWAAADAAATRSVEGRPASIRAAATGPGAGQSSGAGQVADDRVRTGRGGRGDDAEKDGDLAERPQKAASGAGSGRWPGSIAAKGVSTAGRRGGEHSAARAAGRGRAVRPASGTGSAARDPAARAPAPREPARGDRARTERDRAGRAPGDREPAGRPWGDREPARDEPAARDRGAREWPGHEREPAGRELSGPADRENALADREQALADREPAAPGTREQAAQGPDQEAATPQAQTFRLPSADERAARAREDAARAREDTARRGRADSPAAGDAFWDRVSEELSGSGSQGPVRPAWPSTAGPRAMGAGAAGRHGPSEPGDDEPESAWPSPGYQAEPASGGGETSRPAGGPDGDGEQAEQPAAGESRWERMVPPYVDDLTRPRRDREPAGGGSGEVPASDDSPAGDEAGALAGQEASSAWSAWSSFRATRAEGQGEQRDEDEQRREPVGRAGSELTERVDPDGGPAAGELAETGASAGDVTSGDAGAGDETIKDGSATAAPAADVAGDGKAAESDAEAGEHAPATARAGHAGDAAETGEPDEAETATGEEGAAAGGAGATGSAEEDAAGQATTKAGDGAGAGDTDAGEDAGRAADDSGTPLDDEVTIVPGVARYHRRGCILIRFLSDGDLEITTRREAEATGLVPCKACQPDKPDPSA